MKPSAIPSALTACKTTSACWLHKDIIESKHRQNRNCINSLTGVVSYCFTSELEKQKDLKSKASPNGPECKDLEKQALELELQRQEKHRQQDEQKKTWKEWFKTPDFYKVK